MNGIKTTAKDLRALAHELAVQGLCNEQAMGYGEWAKVHNRQDYTCIAYSQGKFGTIASVYYLKADNKFAYV